MTNVFPPLFSPFCGYDSTLTPQPPRFLTHLRFVTHRRARYSRRRFVFRKLFFFLLEFKKICVETGLLQAAVRKPPEFSRISLFVLLKFAGFYEKKKKIRAADSHGWVLRYDLNKGTSGNYVYLCYRLGFLDGPEEPVTDIVICADTTRTGAGTRPPGPGTLLPAPPRPRSPDQILL